MRYRPNQLDQLTNRFAGGFTQPDQLPIKWPKDGDSTWVYDAEQPYVPLTGRVVRSSHFNQYADAVTAIQLWFKENAGMVVIVYEDGSTSTCSSAATGTITSISTLPTSGVVTAASGLVIGSKSVSHTGLAVSTSTSAAVAITGYTTISTAFGASPWNNPTFNVTITPRIIDSTGRGWWESETTVAAARAKALSGFVVCTGVVPSGTLGIKYFLTIGRHFSVSTSSSGTVTSSKSWNLGLDATYATKFLDSNSNLRVLTPAVPVGGSSTRFLSIRTGNDYSTWAGWNHQATITVTGNSSAFLFMLGHPDHINGENGTPTYSPGGLIFHKEHSNVSTKDAGITFTWHTWSPPIGEDNSVFEIPLPITGPFLRLRKHSSPKTITGVTTETIQGVTRTYPQYWGYALRFFGNRATSYKLYQFYPSIWAGSIAIIKFRYEDFNFDGKVVDEVWYKTQSWSTTTPPGQGGWWGINVAGQNSDGYYYSSTRPGEYKILKQTSISYSANGSRSEVNPWTYNRPATNLIEPYFAPLHERMWGGLPLHSGQIGFNKIKFEVIDSTVSVYTSSDGSSWSLLASALDSEADIETSSTFSVPARFYIKSMHSQATQPNYIDDFYKRCYWESPLFVFSNIDSYTLASVPSDGTSTIDVGLDFLMVCNTAGSGSTSTTTYSSGIA